MPVGPLGVYDLLIIVGAVVISSVVPLVLFWRIFARAGFSGVLSLLVLVPVVGWLLALVVLAFAEWPARQGPHVDVRQVP